MRDHRSMYATSECFTVVIFPDRLLTKKKKKNMNKNKTDKQTNKTEQDKWINKYRHTKK